MSDFVPEGGQFQIGDKSLTRVNQHLSTSRSSFVSPGFCGGLCWIDTKKITSEDNPPLKSFSGNLFSSLGRMGTSGCNKSQINAIVPSKENDADSLFNALFQLDELDKMQELQLFYCQNLL